VANKPPKESPEWRRLQSELCDLLAARLDGEAETSAADAGESSAVSDRPGKGADRAPATAEGGQRGRGYVRLRKERSAEPVTAGGLLHLKHLAKVRREQSGAFAHPADHVHGPNGHSHTERPDPEAPDESGSDGAAGAPAD
jgi:hypothetical protein